MLQLTRKVPDLEQRIKKVKGYLVCGIAEGGWGNRIRNAGYSSSVSLARGFSKVSKRSNKHPSGWSMEPWLGMRSLGLQSPEMNSSEA